MLQITQQNDRCENHSLALLERINLTPVLCQEVSHLCKLIIEKAQDQVIVDLIKSDKIIAYLVQNL